MFLGVAQWLPHQELMSIACDIIRRRTKKPVSKEKFHGEVPCQPD